MNRTFSKHAATFITVVSLVLFIFIQLSFSSRVPDEKFKWYGNDHFKIVQEKDLVTVSMGKLAWESFSVDITHLQSSKGLLSFEVKSDDPLTLRVDGVTADNKQIELFKEELQPGSFNQIGYTLAPTELSMKHLVFYVNPGKVYHGQVYVKGLSVEGASEETDNISAFPNPTTGDIVVELPHAEFNQLIIVDEKGNVVLNSQPNESRKVQLNLQGRKPGLYVLKARSKNKMLTTKIILK